MPKGQLSRVPWPGNSQMLFTFLPASAAPQAFKLTPASYSHQTSTSLATFNMLYELFFFKSKRILQSTTHSTKVTLERDPSHIKVTHPPCLFWLLPWENVNNPNLQYISGVIIKYSWEKLCDFANPLKVIYPVSQKSRHSQFPAPLLHES